MQPLSIAFALVAVVASTYASVLTPQDGVCATPTQFQIQASGGPADGLISRYVEQIVAFSNHTGRKPANYTLSSTGILRSVDFYPHYVAGIDRKAYEGYPPIPWLGFDPRDFPGFSVVKCAIRPQYDGACALNCGGKTAYGFYSKSYSCINSDPKNYETANIGPADLNNTACVPFSMLVVPV